MLMLLVYVSLVYSQVFWYFENKVYCDFENNDVTISIKKSEWVDRCEIYMNTIYQLALKKYDEVSAVRSYIAQGDDVYYWKEVLEKKKSEFIQLVNYRAQIEMAVNEFELALFDKYYNLLQKPLKTYYSELEMQYHVLVSENLSKKTESVLKIAQLEQQMWNVNHILMAKNMDDIMEVVSSYIYLKKQIEWK